jgi:uncharacterized membrane protein
MAKQKSSFWRRVRRRMLSGLILIVPIFVTIFTARFIYDLIDRISQPGFSRAVPILPDAIVNALHEIPGLRFAVTIVILALALYFLGVISRALLVKRAYAAGERLLMRIPLLKDIYALSKQVVELIANKRKLAFKQMALVEFPRPGMLALGFITGQTRMEGPKSGVYVHVLMPLAPIPTQLFLLLVPAEEVRVLQVPMDDALKFLMSGGSVAPGQFPTVAYDPNAPPPSSEEWDDSEVVNRSEPAIVTAASRENKEPTAAPRN